MKASLPKGLSNRKANRRRPKSGLRVESLEIRRLMAADTFAATNEPSDLSQSGVHLSSPATVSNVVTVAGDANRDGVVDFADFLQLSSRFGIASGAQWSDGDFDVDGDVDFADFLSLSGNFGQEADIEIPVPVDDRFEENDQPQDASQLGTITGTAVYDDLAMLDGQDWYRFNIDTAAGEGSHVTLDFAHAEGDLDLNLFDGSSGELILRSTSETDTEQLFLEGLPAGEYYLMVYGYDGADNANYSLSIDRGDIPPPRTEPTLYINFDGADISASDLRRWGSDWSIDFLRSHGRVQVSPYGILTGLSFSAREQVISQVMTLVQEDLEAYGINVERTTGLAVEEQGATTIFVGGNSRMPSHVASDVDYGNDNSTDIAFVMEENEWWGSIDATAHALADVVLHEAGHTFGLFHVWAVGADGYLYGESMGLRYTDTTGQYWTADTSFLDMWFPEYEGHGGGRGWQNAHQTMLATFGSDRSNLALSGIQFTTSEDGQLSITGSTAQDIIELSRNEGGGIELLVNDQRFALTNTTEIRFFTNGDTSDHIVVEDGINLPLVVDSVGVDLNQTTKVSRDLAEDWSGHASTAHSHSDPHAPGGAAEGRELVMRTQPAQIGTAPIGDAETDTLAGVLATDNAIASLRQADVVFPIDDGVEAVDYIVARALKFEVVHAADACRASRVRLDLGRGTIRSG